jgi:hypothetical protein
MNCKPTDAKSSQAFFICISRALYANSPEPIADDRRRHTTSVVTYDNPLNNAQLVFHQSYIYALSVGVEGIGYEFTQSLG